MRERVRRRAKQAALSLASPARAVVLPTEARREVVERLAELLLRVGRARPDVVVGTDTARTARASISIAGSKSGNRGWRGCQSG